ncbi:MAG: precorrin-3B C(17)-methyltransferase [Pseudomonadota bacterium]
MEKIGKIFLVGFGPGSREHMSARAVQAIEDSDVIIGYTTYISLVKDLIKDKQVIRKGMTEEIDRCVEAYEQAKQGKIVAIVSSGDIGIYGMAGPTYEVLFQSGWTPESKISIEVVPGTTALSACAALVGAPLTHDFCSISLSDLLTPWPTIARRLESAGKGDFVIALYNPKSGRRTKQILEAQKILLLFRSAETPVTIVKSAYRRKQFIQHTTLEKMSDCDIGMLSTVLIGNSSTFVQHQLMVTPRGYANKYQNLTGDIHSGEKAGHSLSMGLESWHDCVIYYANQHPEKPFTELADYFDTSEAQIYSALQYESGLNQPIKIKEISKEMGLKDLISQVKIHDNFNIVIKNQSAELSLKVNQGDLSLTAEGLLAINNSHGYTEIKGTDIEKIWSVKGGDKDKFIFTNKQGNMIFTIII